MAKEWAPYGIAAAVLLIVGASAAIPAALVLGATAEPADAGAGSTDASPALPASARAPIAEREDSGSAHREMIAIIERFLADQEAPRSTSLVGRRRRCSLAW